MLRGSIVWQKTGTSIDILLTYYAPYIRDLNLASIELLYFSLKSKKATS